ncbi:hypothetical protein [Streptomyces cahuitamycinicus]|nr:hypothetical protein [Streptomyces cahuitamycinicus]
MDTLEKAAVLEKSLRIGSCCLLIAPAVAWGIGSGRPLRPAL